MLPVDLVVLRMANMPFAGLKPRDRKTWLECPPILPFQAGVHRPVAGSRFLDAHSDADICVAALHIGLFCVGSSRLDVQP